MYAAPTIDQLFGGGSLTDVEQVQRFEAYKSALNVIHQKSREDVRTGRVVGFQRDVGIIKRAETTEDRIASLRDELTTKSVSADQLASLEAALSSVQDIQKELTLTYPLNDSTSGVTGLVPYNLDPVLSMLIPKELTLRNSTTRVKDQGQSFEFRRITGLSNAGVGGIGNLSSFFNPSTASTTFNGITLNRPTQIQYAADKIVLPFVSQGLSDSVDSVAEFAGQGYQDLRQLSHTALVWATMLAEERNLLGGSNEALSTSGVTGTGAADATGTGITTGTSGSQVYFTLANSFGETASVTAGSTITTVSGQGAKLTSFAGTVPTNVYAIKIYVVTTTVETYVATIVGTLGGTTALKFSLLGSGDLHPVADTSFSALAYEGLLETIAESGGYVDALNATVSSVSEPAGFMQDAFQAMWLLNMADPEIAYTTAIVRRSLAKAIQDNAGTASYRITYEQGSDGITLGSLVQAVQNEVTGKMVQLMTHRFMPAGVMAIHTKQLPFPDSGVSATMEVHNVVDMAIVEWPQIGFSWDISSFLYGSVAFRAPAWDGLITGILG